MQELDCRAGGGQLVRTGVALATLTGTPVRLTGVRADRPTPGLKPQHLAVVEALAAICDAETGGVERGARTFTFEPGAVAGGDYRVEIETAGSLSLLFDAVGPLAAVLDRPLALAATGGTDVAWSPPVDYLRQVKAPLLRASGVGMVVEVGRRGYYPEGGGRATLRLWPSEPRPITLTERGERRSTAIHSVSSADLADAGVARRQADAAAAALDDAGIETDARHVTVADAPSTGSAVVLAARYDEGVAGASALGEPGTPAEDVASDAVDRLRRFERTAAPVDRQLADQLLVWLALAGGRLRVPAWTDHVETSLDLLDSFGVGIDRRAEDVVVEEPLGI